ncbi:MAG: hypothetical protein GXP24_13275 [Planctomycetes bacterium]|nr:hypothetical protein [Planctomycetota bacterium]
MSDVSDLLAAQQKYKRYSAPRRFDLATLLVVTAAYAMLFTGLKALDFSSSIFLYVAGLITLVAIAQSLFATWEKPRLSSFLFRNDPRQVSILVGIVFHMLLVFRTYGVFIWQDIQRGVPLGKLVMSLLAILLPGALMGYFSGVLVAGVFLIADNLRKFFTCRNSSRKADQNTRDESPWDD